jgi:hypothetical protein
MLKEFFKKWALQYGLKSLVVCFEKGMEISGSMQAQSSLASWANIRF